MNYSEFILRYLASLVSGRRERRPLVVGVCGSQGCGKTTLLGFLGEQIPRLGYSIATLSLDDYYLDKGQRARLAETVHPLLRTRGVPGTHSVDLLRETVERLHAHGEVAVPVFDKATDDQLPSVHWRKVAAPVDLILIEGWCIGAIAQVPTALEPPINGLERIEDPDGTWRRWVNRQLVEVYEPLNTLLDHLILLAAPNFEIVHRWRLQQEQELRQRVSGNHATTGCMMSDADLRRFIEHYERLTRHIVAEMPARADVVVRLDETRKATHVTLRPNNVHGASPESRL